MFNTSNKYSFVSPKSDKKSRNSPPCAAKAKKGFSGQRLNVLGNTQTHTVELLNRICYRVRILWLTRARSKMRWELGETALGPLPTRMTPTPSDALPKNGLIFFHANRLLITADGGRPGIRTTENPLQKENHPIQPYCRSQQGMASATPFLPKKAPVMARKGVCEKHLPVDRSNGRWIEPSGEAALPKQLRLAQRAARGLGMSEMDPLANPKLPLRLHPHPDRQLPLTHQALLVRNRAKTHKPQTAPRKLHKPQTAPRKLHYRKLHYPKKLSKREEQAQTGTNHNQTKKRGPKNARQ